MTDQQPPKAPSQDEMISMFKRAQEANVELVIANRVAYEQFPEETAKLDDEYRNEVIARVELMRKDKNEDRRDLGDALIEIAETCKITACDLYLSIENDNHQVSVRDAQVMLATINALQSMPRSDAAPTGVVRFKDDKTK